MRDRRRVWLPMLALSAVMAWQAIGTGNAGGPSSALATQAQPQAQQELRVGDTAPDFTLPDQDRQAVQLSQFRGRTVQIAFYVWAFSPG